MANPRQVSEFFAAAGDRLDGVELTAHFHNTRNPGYANALAAVEEGVRVLDSSLGGFGGCPFAPAATGNIATEDLLYMLAPTGLAPPIALAQMVETGRWLGQALGKELPSKQAKAPAFPPAR